MNKNSDILCSPYFCSNKRYGEYKFCKAVKADILIQQAKQSKERNYENTITNTICLVKTLFEDLESQPTSNNPPRNRNLRTQEDMLAPCNTTNSNDTPHAGLKNTGVICYANAIFQALASLHHLTTLFNDPPTYNSGTFPLNHAFCTLLHLMVMRQGNQDSVVDASPFLKLFYHRRKDFQDNECKIDYDICCFP